MTKKELEQMVVDLAGELKAAKDRIATLEARPHSCIHHYIVPQPQPFQPYIQPQVQPVWGGQRTQRTGDPMPDLSKIWSSS